LDYALAFDIDGVLMLGTDAIPAGAKALQLLEKRKIPYILLTNGGGKWEPDRVAELSDRLGVNVFSQLQVEALTLDLGESVYPKPYTL
jgi:ribonucleotide monophosphatase NagD (HAD superfamily)